MGDDSTKSNEKTFQLEDSLPSLPVPLLDKTLQKYLETVKVFATEEEYLKTKNIVQEFEDGIGLKLQEKLEEKAKNNRNWLEKWWENMAYLSVREPLAVIGCMVGLAPIASSFWPPTNGTQIRRASKHLFGFVKYFSILRREEVPVMRASGGKVFSMFQYRRFFCTSRIPGEEIDSLVCHFKTASEGPCPTHAIVFCNGHIYKMGMFDKSGQQLGSNELERQLKSIKERSTNRGQCIGILTADDRTSWAKAYSHLVSLDEHNEENLKVIQSAIMAYSLDGASPMTETETMHSCFAGKNGFDRWFDKSSGTIAYETGVLGYVADHCPSEGVIIAEIEVWIDELVMRTKLDYLGSPEMQSDEIVPEEIIFKIDSKIAAAKEHATQTYQTNAQKIEVCASRFTLYGRNFPKEQRIHPDIYFQLAIQLTSYTKYGRPVPCYETATTRKFYHGRTETIRNTTQEVVNWCKAMNDPDVSVEDRVNLLRSASGKQMMMSYECLEGRGIDRHLLGLYAASKEMGVAPPSIFTDPCFSKSGGNGNFVLSTSLIGYIDSYGGVAPMRQDGYGIFYNLCKEHFFILVTAFKDCKDTDSLEFFQGIGKSLNQMQELILESKK